MILALDANQQINLLGSASAAATAIAAIVALLYAKGQVTEARNQLKNARTVAYLDFLLRVDDAFQRHQEVHQLLQPAFAWGNNKGGPQSAEDWFKVTSYMGLFERINFLVELGVEQLELVDKLHGYRVYNIVSNNVIRRTKLEDKEIAAYWEGFINLWLKLKALHSDWNDYPNVVLVSRRREAPLPRPSNII